jgi:hypothetical protein
MTIKNEFDGNGDGHGDGEEPPWLDVKLTKGFYDDKK